MFRNFVQILYYIIMGTLVRFTRCNSNYTLQKTFSRIKRILSDEKEKHQWILLGIIFVHRDTDVSTRLLLPDRNIIGWLTYRYPSAAVGCRLCVLLLLIIVSTVLLTTVLHSRVHRRGEWVLRTAGQRSSVSRRTLDIFYGSQ